MDAEVWVLKKGRDPLLAFFSCESICSRAQGLRELCDLVH